MKLLAKERKTLSGKIADLCKGYKDNIQLAGISEILKSANITLEECILTGRDGQATLDMFRDGIMITNSTLWLSWHKGETGRWETVAYLS